MRRLRLTLVPIVLLLSVGCFQGQRTFKVNADGSGTIVDATRLGAQAQGMLAGMEGMDTTSPAEKKAKQMAKFAEKAAAMGEGVTFVSSEAGKDGAQVVTYAFKDITKVTASGIPAPNEATTSNGKPITFKFAKNAAGNPVLTIISPGDDSPNSAAEAPEEKKAPEDIQRGIAMMKGMLAGLKIKSVVEVNGTLVKASGAEAAGSAVTLLEMDFDALDVAALQKLAEAPSGAPPTPAMMRGVNGITVSEPKVTIEFKGPR